MRWTECSDHWGLFTWMMDTWTWSLSSLKMELSWVKESVLGLVTVMLLTLLTGADPLPITCSSVSQSAAQWVREWCSDVWWWYSDMIQSELVWSRPGVILTSEHTTLLAQAATGSYHSHSHHPLLLSVLNWVENILIQPDLHTQRNNEITHCIETLA